MWIAELDEIFIEEELATELDELANIQTKYASAETFADLEEIHTLLVLLEEDVFHEIDFDEEDFTVDEGKVWAQEWIDEVIEYLTETEGNQQDIDDLEAARLLVDAATSYDELFEAEDAIIEVEERLDWESFDDTQDEEYDFDEEKAFALEALDAIIDMAQADDETDLVVALTDIRATVSAATDFDGLEDAEDEFWELEDQVGDYVDQFFIAYEEDYEDDDEYPDDLTTDDLQDWTEYVDEFLGDLEDYDLDVANLQESIDTLQNKIANASDEDVDTIAQGLVGIEESINQLLEELDA